MKQTTEQKLRKLIREELKKVVSSRLKNLKEGSTSGDYYISGIAPTKNWDEILDRLDPYTDNDSITIDNKTNQFIEFYVKIFDINDQQIRDISNDLTYDYDCTDIDYDTF